MTRAVAFAGTIAKSKQFADMFRQVTGEYVQARKDAGLYADAPALALACDVEQRRRHVQTCCQSLARPGAVER
jgi:predicted helicase